MRKKILTTLNLNEEKRYSISKSLPVMGTMTINSCPICNTIPIVECILASDEKIEQNTKEIIQNDFYIYYNCKCLNCGFETDLGKWNRLRSV